MSQPIPFPFRAKAVVDASHEVVDLVDHSFPTDVPFGGGTYDALLVPEEGAPLVVYARLPFPAWITDVLAGAGISPEAVNVVVLAQDEQHGRFYAPDATHIVPLEPDGVLLVLTV